MLLKIIFTKEGCKMSTEIDKLINFTKEALTLDRYILKRYHLYEKTNIFNEISYTLTMEWFPDHLKEWEDTDINPNGTAVIEIDIEQRKFVSIIFVGGKTYVDEPLLNDVTKSNVVQWIEQETELIYDEQFQLQSSVNNEFSFVASFHKIPIYPPANIDIKFDHSGKLVHYSIHGFFPDKTLINVETYTLSRSQIEQIARNQLKFIKFPDDKRKQLRSIYGIEEVFITNNSLRPIVYDPSLDERQVVEMNKNIKWQSPLQSNFIERDLNLSAEVSMDQALSKERKKVLKQLTKDDQMKCFNTVKDFLRQQYATDSGKWQLNKLYRENNYIVAIVRPIEKTNFIFKRKLTVYIDQQSFKIVNYIDNKFMLDVFADYRKPERPIVTKENAYEQLTERITVEPVYVFDPDYNKYILCGKLDCQYGLDAVSGDIIHLDHL